MTTFYAISLKLFNYKITDEVTDMKITYYGTSAAEAWPALFYGECEACRLARKYGGRMPRTRSQALIDDTLLLDFHRILITMHRCWDSNLRKVRTLYPRTAITIIFFPADLGLKADQYAEKVLQRLSTVYGNETVISMCEMQSGSTGIPEQYIHVP